MTTQTIAVRMAKAGPADIAAAYELASLVENLEKGYYPAREGEDGPMHFDEDNADHLRYLFDRLTELGRSAPGGLFRVVAGLHTLLSPDNAIVDPDDDCLELHPRIKQALAG